MKKTEVRIITAKEAKAISDHHMDIVAMISEIIYEAASTGYGGVYIDKKLIKDYDDLSCFISRYYKRKGYEFWDSQSLSFWITWDKGKEEKKISETHYD